MGFTPDPSDPFYDFMKPPDNETQTQKVARMEREADAQRINDAIEAQINKERVRIQQEERIVKVLLLGQSESDLRMQYAHAEWTRERNGWHTVVHFNVIRSINAILRIVEAGIMNNNFESDENDRASSDESMKFTNRHQILLSRLAPLSIVETNLKRKLVCFVGQFAIPFIGENDVRPLREEFYFRSWSDFLEQEALGAADPTTSIAEYKNDMKALWNDPVVRLALKNHRHQIKDTASLWVHKSCTVAPANGTSFLNDLDRVADRNYTVTDDDVFRARLRTLGIQEYEITLDRDSGGKWRIFDVGGCRTLRRAWLPYFENVDVIIFFSPVSVFDERLEEDRRVNRLEDSFAIWTAICSSQLLAKTQLLLFLTKCDLLTQKLRRGIKVNQYLPSYGDRPNDMTTFVKYLREYFLQIMKRHSPERRQYHVFLTSSDSVATGFMAHSAIRDAIQREYLASAAIL